MNVFTMALAKRPAMVMAPPLSQCVIDMRLKLNKPVCHYLNAFWSSNTCCLKCNNRKGYVGGWIYPEYSVAWFIPVVGFDS